MFVTIWVASRRALRSPKLALATLAFLAIYAVAFAWTPWMRSLEVAPPAWASALGLDTPFSSPVFLAAIVLVFLETLVCTIDRTHLTLEQWRGMSRRRGLALPRRDGRDVREFLERNGFRARGSALFRFRHALWGGWILHVGLLALILGIGIQRAFHDGGAFELAIGERARLTDSSVVFGRDRGPFAPEAPPDLEITLAGFDPFMHQAGYSADRASRLLVRQSGEPELELPVDRAEGASIGGVRLYQAIPTGLALTIDVEGIGVRSVHLRQFGTHAATAEVTDPAGRTVKFILTSERPVNDRFGTGSVDLLVEREGFKSPVTPGQSFAFGQGRATLLEFSRWGGFTYSRSPGMPLVFASFGIILFGCLLLVFPSGVAHVGPAGGDTAGWVWMKRAEGLLLDEWMESDGESRPSGR